MTEKVLGFKQTDAKQIYIFKGKTNHERRMNHYKIDEDELVPVVSVKWLEKWCEQESKAVGFGKETRGFMFGRDVILKGLLKAVRLQALPTRQAETSTTALEQSCKPAVAGKKKKGKK